MARSKRVRRTKRSTAAKPRSATPTPKLACSTPWPTIEAFLESEDGDIMLGSLGYNSTLGYTAVASDQHNMLVALVRRSGETLHQLLDRLENALGPALKDQLYVNEINGPS